MLISCIKRASLGLPKCWYSFVSTLHLSSDFPANQTSVSPTKLQLLSCPLDGYRGNTYMGVAAELYNNNTFVLKWRGQFCFLLLQKEQKTFRYIGEGTLDWMGFDQPEHLHHNQTNDPMPAGKCLTQDYVVMPGMTLLLFNGAVKLNIDSSDILKIINAVAEHGIIDYELYGRLLETKYRQLLKRRFAATPYSRLAKYYIEGEYGAKDTGGLACIFAEIHPN